MENLDIKGSFTSPTIFFDIENLIFTIEGECRPENVLTFFQPILDWLDDLKVHAAQQNYNSKVLQFNFKIEYFNSSSAKFIFTIFKNPILDTQIKNELQYLAPKRIKPSAWQTSITSNRNELSGKP